MTEQLPQTRTDNPNGILYHDQYLNIDYALLPTGGKATAHAPTLIETNDGGLLCAWFAGSFEGSGDISTAVSKYSAQDHVWDQPQIVSHGQGRSEQNPASLGLLTVKYG